MCANKDGDKKIRKVSSRRQGNETQRTKKFDDGFKQDLTKWKDGRSNNIQFDYPDTPHTRLEIRKSFRNTSCSEKYTCLENPEQCYFRNIQYELRGAVNNI